MNAIIFVCWSIAFFRTITVRPPAFFPASAVGDEIGNYAIASAGTIVEPTTTDNATNTNAATESVCPKGWTLPTTKQTSAIGPIKSSSSTYIVSFTPVRGGYYNNGVLNVNATTYGFWWSSETSDIGPTRYRLVYNSDNLYTDISRRYYSFYIRCVSEEKTVTDLTYLQDMTGEIANNTLDGTTASLITRWLPRTHHLRSHHLRH